MIVKLSILLQYISIFMPHRQGQAYIATHVLIWTNIVYYTVSIFLYFFEVCTRTNGKEDKDANVLECTPREKLWNARIPGHCISTHQLGVASGTVNVVSDFSIFILPLPIIRRLQMSTKKRVRVYGCFCLGLVACISSVVRVGYSIAVMHTPNSSPDYLIVIDITGLWRYEKTLLPNVSMASYTT